MGEQCDITYQILVCFQNEEIPLLFQSKFDKFLYLRLFCKMSIRKDLQLAKSTVISVLVPQYIILDKSVMNQVK